MGRLCRAVVFLALLPCAGCDFSFSLTVSGDGGSPPVFVSVGSDPATDGDVREDGVVTASSVVFCGFDPFAPLPLPEYRGFLSFPLGGIPPGAFIESAVVTFHVDRVDPTGGSQGLVLDLDRVQYGEPLASRAFSLPGTPVRGFLSGMRLVPAPVPQPVSADVTSELQSDVDDPFLRFFQLRLMCTGGLAQVVDGAGNRAGGAPRDRTLAPVLSVRYRVP